MRRKAHVRFGERGGRNRRAYPRYGAPAPTLRDPSPSLEDVAFTRRLVVACEAVGVKLIDHLILGSTHRWISLRDRGVW